MLRKPNSISPGDTIIQDPVMEPYFITRSQTGGYVVYERVVKGEKKTEYIKTHGYPSTFNSALRMVAKEKLNSGEKAIYTSLKEYVNRWETIQKELLSITTIDV
jgi:hypothetical protein